MRSSQETNSSTLEAMATAVSPIFSMMSAGEPLSPNLSLTPTILILVGDSSDRTSATAEPRPVSYTHLRAHET